MFLRLCKLEQLEFKLDKIIGIYKHAGKVGNDICILGNYNMYVMEISKNS